MKSPLGQALAARRRPQMPAEMPSEGAPHEMQESEGGESKVAALLASLGEDEKLELFEALKSEMSAPAESEETGEGASESMTDERGMLKSTPGEMAALESEGAEEPLNPNENSFVQRARRNIDKLTKQGKFK